jgi:hypothetical protein
LRLRIGGRGGRRGTGLGARDQRTQVVAQREQLRVALAGLQGRLNALERRAILLHLSRSPG